MNRRDAVAGLLALAAMTGPLRTNAQATKESKPFRILTLPDLTSARRGWFSEAMSDLGWAEGRDFIVVQSGFQGYHFSERQLDEAARRFVADEPDLIVTTTTA